MEIVLRSDASGRSRTCVNQPLRFLAICKENREHQGSLLERVEFELSGDFLNGQQVIRKDQEFNDDVRFDVEIERRLLMTVRNEPTLHENGALAVNSLSAQALLTLPTPTSKLR